MRSVTATSGATFRAALCQINQGNVLRRCVERLDHDLVIHPLFDIGDGVLKNTLLSGIMVQDGKQGIGRDERVDCDRDVLVHSGFDRRIPMREALAALATLTHTCLASPLSGPWSILPGVAGYLILRCKRSRLST